MSSIFDSARNLLKNLQGKATSVGNFIGQDFQRIPQVQTFNAAKQTIQNPQFQQGYNQVKTTIQNNPIVQKVGSQPLLQGPGVGPVNFTIPKGPTVGQYTGGQIIKPIEKGLSSLLLAKNVPQAVQGGLQAAGGVFSATPGGFIFNATRGGIAGGINALKGKPLGQSLTEGISQNPSIGNAITKNPLLAGGIDLVSGSPKSITGALGKTEGLLKGLVGVSPKAFNIHPEDQKVLTNIIGTIQAGGKIAEGDKKTLQLLADHYLGQKYSVGSTDKIAKTFDYFLAKQNGGIPGKLPAPSYLTSAENKSVVSQITKAEGSATKLKGTPPQVQAQLPKENPINLVGSDSSLPQDTRQVLNGQQLKERGFVTSVKESDKTPQGVKDLVSGNYVVKSNDQLKKDALSLIKSDPQAAEQLALNPQNDTHVQIGNELINYYASKGQFDKAAQIGEGMAKSGTDFGRAVQAFSQYDKTTPQGAIRFAQSKINEFNKLNPTKTLKITDEQVKGIFDKAHAIQGMPDGRERNIAANELMNTVNNLIPSSIGDKLVTVWKAGLLTSLRTHERNLIGNTLHGAAEIAKDVPAAIADKALSFKTGQRTLTPTLKGIGTGVKTGLQAAKDIATKGYDPTEAISKYDVGHITWGNNPIEQGLKHYTNAVFRTLGGEDKPFYNAAFARSLYDQAGAQAKNLGKSGDKGFIESLVKSPTPEMLGNATKDANIATFHDTSKLGNVAKAVQNLKVGGIPVGQIVAPFTGVPSSIAQQIVAYSPVGLVRGIFNAGKVAISSKEIPNLQRQASQEIGRGVIGSGLVALGAYLAGKGLITGQPKDANESRQWQLQGKQPNSILIGGKWRSIGSIGPENLVILAGAKAQQEAAKGNDASTGTYAASVGKDFLGQTFLQGVQGPLNAFSDPARYAQSYLGSQISSGIPNIIKDTAKAFDPLARQNNSIQDYVTNSIPGLRNKNLPQRDALGTPVTQSPTGPGAFVDLFNSKSPINNIVTNELGRLNDVGNNATPSKINKAQTIGKVKVTLTPQQLDQFEAKTGVIAKTYLAQMFQSPGYQSATDEQKAKAVDALMSKIRTYTKGTLGVKPTASNQAGNASGSSQEQQVANGVRQAKTPQQKQAIWSYYTKQGYITSQNINQIKALLSQ